MDYTINRFCTKIIKIGQKWRKIGSVRRNNCCSTSFVSRIEGFHWSDVSRCDFSFFFHLRFQWPSATNTTPTICFQHCKTMRTTHLNCFDDIVCDNVENVLEATQKRIFWSKIFSISRILDSKWLPFVRFTRCCVRLQTDTKSYIKLLVMQFCLFVVTK